MPRATHLYVFTYDIERDGARARVAALLEGELVRVQRSVFEGRLTAAAARRLADRAAALIGPADSLRAYAVTEEGRAASVVHGGAPLAERSAFLLF